MGMYADDALSDAIDHENHFQSYLDGDLTTEEAYELGLIDETGASPQELVNSRLSPGVMDVQDLNNQLALCDGALSGSPACIDRLMGAGFSSRKPVPTKVIHYWRSGDQLLLPADMTDAHLKNALAYANHNNMKDPIVSDIAKEIRRRGEV